MSRINCEHCNALVMPGAPFCMTCFAPFEDAAPPPAVPAQATPATTPVPAAVGAPAAGANDFFAPPPTQFVSHPGEGMDWRQQAPTAALLTPERKAATSRTPMIVAGVVAVLLLVGVVLGGRALLGGPSEKEQLATAFREARPPDMLPSLPDFSSMTSGLSEETELPGQAKAYVQGRDPEIRAANAALLDLQRTMTSWAKGSVTDDALRAQIAAFNKLMDKTADNAMVMDAPASTHRGLLKLAEAVTEYRIALGALLDWLDSQAGGSRMMYRISVGSANQHWDDGLVNLYRAGGLPTPPLPHPQPKKK